MDIRITLIVLWIAVMSRKYVYCACTTGFWGPNCTRLCGHCYTDPVVCNQATGYCNVTRCANGYEGRQCIKECDPGRYGGQCSGKCGKCRVWPCNFMSGRCINDECSPGYQGLYCTKLCSVGLYGPNCKSHCGHCKSIYHIACNFINGACQDGCQDGYQGQTCSTACTAGLYGTNCAERCGQCRIGTTCDKVSGLCPAGCQPGFTGLDCKTGQRVPTVSSRSAWIPVLIAAGCIAGFLLIVGGFICLVFKRSRDRQRRERIYTNYHHYDSCTTYERPITPGVSSGEIQSYGYGYGRVADWYEEIGD